MSRACPSGGQQHTQGKEDVRCVMQPVSYFNCVVVANSSLIWATTQQVSALIIDMANMSFQKLLL